MLTLNPTPPFHLLYSGVALGVISIFMFKHVIIKQPNGLIDHKGCLQLNTPVSSHKIISHN